MAGPVIEGKLNPVQRFIRLLQLDTKAIGQLYFYAIFQGLVMLSLPLGIQAIINLIQGGMLPTSWWILVFIVVLGILVSGALFIMQLHITENLQQKIFTRAAFEFAYRIPKIQFDLLNRRYVPELVNRFFDVMTVQKGVSKVLLDFSSAILQILFGVLLLSFYHPVFILFGVLLLVVVALILKVWGPRGLKTSLEESAFKYDVVFWLEEIARSLRVFKVNDTNGFQMNRTDSLVSSYLQSRTHHFKILVSQYVSLVVFKACVAAGLLILGSILVVEQQINLGQFVAAEIIILLVINSVEKVIISLGDIYDILTAIEKVGSVTDWPVERTHEGSHKSHIEHEGAFKLEVNNLSFTYPEASNPTFKNLNLLIEPGTKWYISGANGSGKSTLIHLLAGFYSKFEGTLLLNGLSLLTWNLNTYRNYLGTCFTDEELFHATLRDNITMGRADISDEDIMTIAQKVFLDKSLRELPQGLDTWIDPDGKRLPKSVVRKIILTRALVKRPKLVLIEDNLHHINSAERNAIWTWITSKEAPFTLIAITSEEDVKPCFENEIIL